MLHPYRGIESVRVSENESSASRCFTIMRVWWSKVVRKKVSLTSVVKAMWIMLYDDAAGVCANFGERDG